MSLEPEKEPMHIDSPGEEGKESPDRFEGNGLQLYRVSANANGAGLPYAPEGWPNPGDTWSWKVGKRTTASGYYLDRYLYAPDRLREPGQRRGFASKLSLEQFIRAKFPNADVGAFFASFSWRIPSKPSNKDNKGILRLPAKPAAGPGSNGLIGEPHCKAGNRFCSSLAAGEVPNSEVMFCDICCSEPGFCRDCCCVLCCETIDKASEGYSYITCVAKIEGSVCGHSCHTTCALRSYMAGTVQGIFGLDAEYYCRRCDSRSDMVSHVVKLLQKCESNVSRDYIEKTLVNGIRLLLNSNRPSAKQLLDHVQSAMSKLKNGTCTDDIWRMEDVSAASAGVSSDMNGPLILQKIEGVLSCQTSTPSSKFDYRIESLKLDNEIDEVLDALRKSQQIEYRLAEEKLQDKKNHVLNLYEQLDTERSTLSRHASTGDIEPFLTVVLERISQVKEEVEKLKDMREVAKGFGNPHKNSDAQYHNFVSMFVSKDKYSCTNYSLYGFDCV
ncbi:hypothetical protein ACS0TY_022745 [Phlomoides rotata]